MKSITTLFFATLLLTACHQNSYKISGTSEGLANGDTLLLSKDINSLPSDTIIVREGAFEYEGTIDSARLAFLYLQKEPEISTTLFLEPGTINVHLSEVVEKIKVGGTASNDALQEANYIAYRYSEEMKKISMSVATNYNDSAAGLLAKAQLEHLKSDMTKMIIDVAERNIDNEFGYLIVANMEDDEFSLSKRLSLIDKMPAEFRKRPEIQTIIKGTE